MFVVVMVPATKEFTKRPIIAAVALATAAAAVIVWRLAQPPTLEEVARETLVAVESGNGAAALKFVHPDEASALQLTNEKLDLVLRKLQDSIPPSTVTQGLSPEGKQISGMYELAKSIPLSDGKEMVLAVSAISTDKGPKVLSLIYCLFMYGVTKDFPKDSDQRKGVSKIKHTIDSFPRVSEMFKSAGINGIYLADPTETKTLTWEEYWAVLNSKLIEGQRRAKVQMPEQANPKD